MTTAAQTVPRNAPETNSRKTQVTVSRAIHVLSTEDEPLQVVTHRVTTCRNLESGENRAFSDVSKNRELVQTQEVSAGEAENSPNGGSFGAEGDRFSERPVDDNVGAVTDFETEIDGLM